MADGGERKLPLITRYWSSKSTARNVCMASDLEGPDRMAKIAPDEKKQNQQGINPRSKGTWTQFEHHSGGRTHPQRN